MINILLTGAFKYSKEQLKQISDLGYKIFWCQYEQEELAIDVSNIEVVICNALFQYQDISKFKNLRCIQLTSAGLDRVPLDYIQKKNIRLYNAKGVYSIPMAEWTILKILEIYKESYYFYQQQESCIWEKRRDIQELSGKKAAIIGYGNVGMEIAKRLKAFGVEVFAVNKTAVECSYIDHSYYLKELENIIEDIDIIVISIAYVPATHHLINSRIISKIKKGSILINVSRGKVIDQAALINAIIDEKFRGVALDVFDEEPLDRNSLIWKLKGMIVTPHNSYISEKNNQRLFNCFLSNLNNYTKE